MIKGSLSEKAKLIQVGLEKANAELDKTSLTPAERARIINMVCRAIDPIVREQLAIGEGK